MLGTRLRTTVEDELASLELSLIIEIDGAYHKTEDTRKRDEALHMSNYEVMHLPDNFTDLQADILVAGIKAINSPG